MDDTLVTRGHGLLEKFLARKRTRMANRLIPAYLREGRILDIGCGRVPYFLLNTVFTEKYGLDKVAQVASREKVYNQYTINLVDFDLDKNRELPFDSQYFDVVTMLAVIEHIIPQKLPILMNEILRVLKTDGVCVITTPAPWTGALLKSMAGLRLVSPEEINEHKAAYSGKRLGSVFATNGFEAAAIRSGYFECFMNVWVTARKGD